VAQFGSTPAAPPLTLAFDAGTSADPDGAIIEYAWDWDGDGLYDGFSDSPLATHTFPAAQLYQVTLRVTDDQFARGTVTIGTASGNLPPLAALSAIPGSNLPPSSLVTLSGAASSDPDGSIAMFEWDGDGNPGYEWNSGTVDTYDVYTPGNAGSKLVRLRVTDDGGASSEASLVLESQGWVAQPVGAIGTGTQDKTSLAIVDGRPAIAYAINFMMPMPPPIGGDNGVLYYVIAADAHASAWETPVVVSDAGYFPGVTLLVCDGRPCIAHSVDVNHDFIISDQELRFSRAMDSTGAAWHGPLLVDKSSNAVGEYMSAAVVAGKPAIAACDFADTSLYYSAATNAAGTAWAPRVGIDTAGFTGYDPSLADINGIPAVAYHSPAVGMLRYAYGLDSAGSSWSVPLILDSNGGGGNTGHTPSLQLVNGRPAVAYRNNAGQELQYIRALDAQGASWPPTPLTVDTTGNTGITPCLAVVGGVPAVCYGLDNPDYDLLYSAASDASGSAWGLPEQAETFGQVGYWSSMAVLGNRPVVCFADQGAGLVRLGTKY
jgi:hypothetical protein